MPKDDPIKAVLAEIHRKFGKEAIMRLGDQKIHEFPSLSSGCLSLDLALGIGGFPRGRISEIAGTESAGKSTIALHLVAQAQKLGGMAAYIDAEHSMDIEYAKKLGVDASSLLISQPDYGEQALTIAQALVESQAIDVIIVDSVAALIPKAELDGEYGDSNMGLMARLMSQAMRKITGATSKSNTCLVFINQYRDKIGVTYGNPNVTTGGRALKFYSSVRIDLSKGEQVKDGEKQIGIRPKARIIKNKMAPPLKEAHFEIIFGEGISREADLLDLGESFDVVTRSGSWYAFNDEKLGNGREQAKKFLKSNQDLARKIEDRIREEHRKGTTTNAK